MRYQLAICAIALSITSTSAQSIADIPSCASTAAIKSISSTSCNITDLKCICASSAWIQTLIPEVSKACPAADLEKTRTVTVALCKNLGVDLVLPSDTTSPATATSAAKSGASSTSAAVVSAAKSGASAAATLASSVGASLASSASAAVAAPSKTGSATALGPHSGLLEMMGIAIGMMVL